MLGEFAGVQRVKYEFWRVREVLRARRSSSALWSLAADGRECHAALCLIDNNRATPPPLPTRHFRTQFGGYSLYLSPRISLYHA